MRPWWGYIKWIIRHSSSFLSERERAALTKAIADQPSERAEFIDTLLCGLPLKETGIPMDVAKEWNSDFILSIAFYLGFLD